MLSQMVKDQTLAQSKTLVFDIHSFLLYINIRLKLEKKKCGPVKAVLQNPSVGNDMDLGKGKRVASRWQ